MVLRCSTSQQGAAMEIAPVVLQVDTQIRERILMKFGEDPKNLKPAEDFADLIQDTSVLNKE